MTALDVHLDDAQRTLLADTTALARDVLAPLVAAGPHGRVDGSLLRGLAAHGLLDRLFGGGASAMTLCLIREGLARACTAAETAFAVQGLGAFPLLEAGDPALRAAWIPRLAAGEGAAAFALSEPDAGSDVAALALAAERVDGGYVLTGEKTWISNAPDALLYTVFARTSAGRGARGITAFAIPGDSPGLSGEALTLISPHPIGSLRFEAVFAADEQVIGDVDRGFGVAMATLDRFRPSVGAFAVGMAQAALDLAVAHASSRQAFGGPLSALQAVSHRLADVATRLQAARLLVHQAASAYDGGVRAPQLAAMAKLMATEVAQEAVDAAIQVHGARALESDHPLAHLYRDVRAPRIYEGASEIQREIIARSLFRGTPA